MSKGHFVDGDGRPIYFGDRASRGKYEADYEWVPRAPGEQPKVGGLERWNGSRWVEDSAAVSAKAANDANRARRTSDQFDIPEIVDALVAKLLADGLVSVSDLGPAYARRQATKT